MAKVVLDHQEDGICLMYGLAQLCEGEKFSQTAVMLTPKEILFYDDNIPNQVVGDVHYHNAKVRILINELKTVIIKKIKHYDYKIIYELSFIGKRNSNISTSELFCKCFFKKDEFHLNKQFINNLRHLSIKVKKVSFKSKNDF